MVKINVAEDVTSKAMFIFLLALATNNETIGKIKLAKEVMIINY